MASADILRAADIALPLEVFGSSVFAGPSCIAVCDGPQLDPDVDAERAAFIVRACNAHYQMLEALKALDAWWTDSFPAGPDAEDVSYGFGKLSSDTLAIWRQVRAAIAAAEAEAGR